MSPQPGLVDADRLVGDVDVVAPRLLNTLIVVGPRVARVVEVEAYDGEHDPASHAFRGRTERNAVMFGPPGRLYVYRSYGLHWCANVVVAEPGRAAAVLLRAVEPLDGLELMQADRPAVRRPVELSNGPGKLCAALGITGQHGGVDLLSAASRCKAFPSQTFRPRSASSSRQWRRSIPVWRARSRSRRGSR